MCLHVCDREREGKCDPFRRVGLERQCSVLYTTCSLPSKAIYLTVNKEFHSSNYEETNACNKNLISKCNIIWFWLQI